MRIESDRTTTIFALLGIIATVIGVWEFLVKDRVLPHHVAYISACDQEIEEIKPLADVLIQNASSAVYLDLDFIYACDEIRETTPDEIVHITDKSIEITLESNLEYVGGGFLKVDKRQFQSTALSRIQQGRGDYSGDRILGVFFVRGNLDAGTFFIELADVGYSKELDDMHVCTRAVADKALPTKLFNYLTTCVLGLNLTPFIEQY